MEFPATPGFVHFTLCTDYRHWRVEAEWTERYRDESLSTAGLLAKVLQWLEIVPFR